jgi:TetR/AcrR family transcriptional regulator, regulator of cefoperazone and chloramphenicol sensitivity
VSSDDLTARARIRDAAIDLFAEKGIGPATIRDIAQAAGVSSGLLRHHFGSKEGLRDACDEWVLARAGAMREQMLARGGFADSSFIPSIHPEAMRMQAYLVRSMQDGSPAAAAMFDRMVEVGEEWLPTTDIKSVDPRAYSAVLVAMKMGMYLLTEQIGRAIGSDTTTSAGHSRMLRAAVEIFTQPMLTAEQAGQAIAALDRLASTTEDKP